MAFVGSDKLTLNGHTLSKSDPRVQLDASAIAKGYACDVVAACLEKHGITDYLVEIGGEMVLKGKNPKGTAWRVGINSPEDDSTSTNLNWDQRLVLTDRSLATSGNYRRFYIKDGRRYAHTIDPKTGYPVQHNLLSATVIAGDCLTADALATAFMVMGADKALKLAEELPDVEAFFICAGPNDSLYTETSSGTAQWLP
jgi:thiamine biosynthesis lipoprotein